MDFYVIQFEILSYYGINNEKINGDLKSIVFMLASLRLWTSMIYILISAKESRISSGELSQCFLIIINTQLKKQDVSLE